MIAMFVVSIITGIICDTFGELRGEMDEAAGYRASTNFITGIPFAVMCVYDQLLPAGWLSQNRSDHASVRTVGVWVCGADYWLAVAMAQLQSGGEEHPLPAVHLSAALPPPPCRERDEPSGADGP